MNAFLQWVLLNLKGISYVAKIPQHNLTELLYYSGSRKNYLEKLYIYIQQDYSIAKISEKIVDIWSDPNAVHPVTESCKLNKSELNTEFCKCPEKTMYFVIIIINLEVVINTTFYSCVLNYLAMNANEAVVDLALIYASAFLI